MERGDATIVVIRSGERGVERARGEAQPPVAERRLAALAHGARETAREIRGTEGAVKDADLIPAPHLGEREGAECFQRILVARLPFDREGLEVALRGAGCELDSDECQRPATRP